MALPILVLNTSLANCLPASVFQCLSIITSSITTILSKLATGWPVLALSIDALQSQIDAVLMKLARPTIIASSIRSVDCLDFSSQQLPWLLQASFLHSLSSW